MGVQGVKFGARCGVSELVVPGGARRRGRPGRGPGCIDHRPRGCLSAGSDRGARRARVARSAVVDRRRRDGARAGRGRAGRPAARRELWRARRWSCACTTRATAVIEEHGPDGRAPGDRRRAITCRRWRSPRPGRGASSGRRWARRRPTATTSCSTRSKSWVTSAGEADSYVWTSRPVDGRTGATLWLVPATTAGARRSRAPFDGLGLRGNASSPVRRRRRARSRRRRRLGDDGAGLDIALGVVLPVFQVLNASCSLGLMDAAIATAIGHVTTARLEHLDQTLADQPVVRQHVAAMKDQRRRGATRSSTTRSPRSATGRADAPLRMLQSKAVAGEAALEVLDLAMRVGGGAAFRKDVGLERHFRDARAVGGDGADARRAAGLHRPGALRPAAVRVRRRRDRHRRLAARSRSAPSPTTRRSSRSGRASPTGSPPTTSPSTTSCTRTTRRRSRRTSPATSTSRGTRRWRGSAPGGSPRPPVARPVPWRCATPIRTSPRSCSCAPTATWSTSPSSKGARVATGAVDSPQATLLPLAHLAGAGLDPGASFDVRRFDVMVGKHGDHVGGERDAVKALLAGDGRRRVRHRRQPPGVRQGGHDPRRGSVRVLTRTAPYDHCTMTVLDDVDRQTVRPVRRAAAVDVVRRPGGAAAARARGPARVAARPHERLRPARGAPSTGSASTDPTDRSRRRVCSVDDRRRPSTSARSASTAAPTSSSSSRSRDVAAGRRRRGARHPPRPRRPARHLVPPAGSPAADVDRRRGPRPTSVVVERGATAESQAGSAPTGPGRAEPDAERRRRAPSRRLGAGGTRRARSSPADRHRRSASTAATRSGPIGPTGSTPRPLAGQWDPDAAIDWTAPDREHAVDRGRRRAGDDVPHRERGGRARRAGPVPRPGPPALPRDPAGARRSPSPTRPATSRSSPGAPRSPGRPLALSTVGGRASLQTLLDEPDFAIASFLLSVMGEGTFVSLLGFLERHAPDPLTRRIAHLTRNDEARHVAFALGHLERHAAIDPGVRARLARAVERRHDALRTTAGLNDEVFDASCCSPPAATTPTPSPPAGTPCRTSSATWTTAAGPASPASASPPARPRRSPRSTPATSCDRQPPSSRRCPGPTSAPRGGRAPAPARRRRLLAGTGPSAVRPLRRGSLGCTGLAPINAGRAGTRWALSRRRRAPPRSRWATEPDR